METEAVERLISDLRRLGTDHAAVEAKRARKDVPHDIWRSIVAFANKRGGIIILGVDEKTGFAVTGVEDPSSTETRLGHLCSTEIDPPIRAIISSHKIEGTWVVVTQVPVIDPMLAPAFHRPTGLPAGAFIRVADGNRQMSTYEVHLLLSRRSQPREELQPVVDATVADLDADGLNAYTRRLRATRSRAFADRDDTNILEMTKILVEDGGRMFPSLAGLMAFGTFPQQFFPQVNLTFVSYPDVRRGVPGPAGERFLDNATVDGPIPVMAEDALRHLRSNMKRAAIIQDIGRTDVWDYPITALREAIVNALVHRDFSMGALGAQVQVELYPNRVTVRNPGGLYGPTDPTSLPNLPVSATRNPVLLRLLEDIPLPEGGMVCENRGSGLAVIAEALAEHGHPAPEFADSLAVFDITFHTRPATIPAAAASREISAVRPDRRSGIPTASMFAVTDASTDSATLRILTALEAGPLSRRELEERTGLAQHVIRYRLDKLRHTGVVKPTGSLRSPRARWELV